MTTAMPLAAHDYRFPHEAAQASPDGSTSPPSLARGEPTDSRSPENTSTRASNTAQGRSDALPAEPASSGVIDLRGDSLTVCPVQIDGSRVLNRCLCRILSGGRVAGLVR
jgi:hypothetical protein